MTLSLFVGIIISLALFWLMKTMISNNQQGFEKTENIYMTEFIRLKRETKLQTKDRKIPDQPPQEKRPPPPKLQRQQVQVEQDIAPKMDVPKLDIPLQTEQFSSSLMNGAQMGAGEISTNVVPLVRIPPRYPTRAANRHIEGWVKIEFTITEQGTVKDAAVSMHNPIKFLIKRP